MKVRGILYILFMVCLLAGCQDDFEEGGMGGELSDGAVTLRFAVQDAAEIYTRADDPSQDAIENVMLAVVETGGSVRTTAFFETMDGDGSVRLYLHSDDQKIYAFCNLPMELAGDEMEMPLRDEIAEATTEDELKNLSLTIKSADGAYPGNFVMTGVWDKTVDGGSDFDSKSDITIDVFRLAAKLDFKIYFEPAKAEDKEDQFALTGIYMFNIPRGSMLLEREMAAGGNNDLDVNTGDYVYNYRDDDEKGYFSRGTGGTDDADMAKGYRLDYEEVQALGDEYYAATFYQFENRQGGVYDDYNSANKTGGFNWSDLSSLQGQAVTMGENYDFSHYKDLFEQYRQIKKRELAQKFNRSDNVNEAHYNDASKQDTGFPYASYIVVCGVYTETYSNGETVADEVMYFVYLGADNYKDFNIRRNHHYTYRISIQAKDEFDTRVFTSRVPDLEVYYDAEILDAHFNVTQALLYSATEWKAYVKNPDETPWLEISTSPRYIPRKAGEASSSDQAQFSLDGGGGMRYLYIHTDEFIPKISSPQENPWYATKPELEGGNRVDMGVKTRTGTIVFESGEGQDKLTKEINVEQYAAQMVILHIKQDVNNLMKEVLDTFYIEQVMEKKNMAWGFEKYWSLDLDQLISKGQWDGLKNTRELYHMALWGAESDVKAYYPDGIPSDIALGYALGKNRDRNGNGKIDAEEIVWYLPAANELQAIYGHTRPFDFNNEDDFYMDYVNARSVYLPYEFGGPFHSSTPSSSDAYGITSGFSYFVNMYNGEKEIGQRSRYYNVICARRHNAWKGDNDGEVNGDMDVDDEWGDGNEVVVPR